MVLPLLLYGSSVWYANIGNLKALESIQRKATKWILFDNDLSYYQRLISVNMLPISLYMEVNDVLLLFKIINGKYDFKWDDYVTFSTGRHKFDVKHVNYERSRHNFWYRTSTSKYSAHIGECSRLQWTQETTAEILLELLHEQLQRTYLVFLENTVQLAVS